MPKITVLSIGGVSIEDYVKFIEVSETVMYIAMSFNKIECIMYPIAHYCIYIIIFCKFRISHVRCLKQLIVVSLELSKLC